MGNSYNEDHAGDHRGQLYHVLGNDILLTSNSISQLWPGTIEHDSLDLKERGRVDGLDSNPNHAPGTVSCAFR